MDMTGAKGRIPKLFNTDNVYLHASGDGATAGRYCRLCGGDRNLRSFADTYLWEGVEERYDQMLFDCFRIRVLPSDGLICEWCVRQIRCAARFKALVYAAFEKPLSSSTQIIMSSPLHGTQTQPNSDEVQAIDSKSIIEMLKTKRADNENSKTRRLYGRKIFDSNLIVRRINVECKVCKQKYPMLTPYGGGKGFICSPCTNSTNNAVMDRFCKRCNVLVPAETMQKHMKSHLKVDLRRKRRQFSLSKKPPQLKRQQEGCLRSGNIPKYKCKICPKKYLTSEHLEEHIKCQHRDKNICTLCKKELKNKDMLVQHMKMHKNHINLNYYLAGPAMLAGKTKRDGKKRGLTRTKRSI